MVVILKILSQFFEAEQIIITIINNVLLSFMFFSINISLLLVLLEILIMVYP
jgi:hypothetical protein